MTHDAQPPADSAYGSDQPGAALVALGAAAGQALQVIRQAITDGSSGPVSPIEAVILLDDALGQLRELQTAVPALLAAAAPGPAVTADIQARADEQSVLTEQVNAMRRELEFVEAREQATRVQLADLSTLREQVDELRRRERLAGALRELNEQRQVIEQRLTLLRQLTEHPEEAIAAGAGDVIRLAEERRALLAPHVRDALSQAADALRALAEEEERARAGQERLSAARERLAAAEQRRAELEAEHDGRLAQLAAHAAADSALAAALSSAGPPGTDPAGPLRLLLDGITTQLSEVDGALQDTLLSGQADYDREHVILGWADRRE